MEEMIYDMYKSLSEDIKSLRNEIAELRSEQQLTNTLLKIILSTEFDDYLLPNANEICAHKSCAIIYKNFDEVYSLVNDIVGNSDKKVYLFEGIKEGDFAACITQAQEGDFILIKGDRISFSDELQSLLLEGVKSNSLNVTIGRGEGARTIKLEVPQLNYVFFSTMDELLPEHLKEVFPIVNEKRKPFNY